jgi:hypothetical protein
MEIFGLEADLKDPNLADHGLRVDLTHVVA